MSICKHKRHAVRSVFIKIKHFILLTDINSSMLFSNVRCSVFFRLAIYKECDSMAVVISIFIEEVVGDGQGHIIVSIAGDKANKGQLHRAYP